MKFGRTLNQYQVPEWSSQYLSYKSLKRQIGQAKRSGDTKGADNAETKALVDAFISSVNLEAKKVNAFFLSQRAITERRIRFTQDRLSKADDQTFVDDELIETINEIRVYLYLVLRYAEMNKTGFRKIVKKADKQLSMDLSEDLWINKIGTYPFCTDTSMEAMLQLVDSLHDRANTLRQKASENGTHVPTAAEGGYPYPEEVHAALDMDNVSALRTVLEKVKEAGTEGGKEESARAAILWKACQKNALSSIALLLQSPHLVSVPIYNDINHRSLLHKLAILGAALKPKGEVEGTPNLIERDDPTLLKYVLSRIPQDMAEQALRVQDFFGRTPLHYTALYGLQRTAQALLSFLPAGSLTGSWVDDDGHSPMFYAVVRGFVDVVIVLIDRWADVDDMGDAVNNAQAVSQSLTPAHQSFTDSSSLPPLISSRSVSALMDGHAQVTRITRTPLALACTFGHAAVARVLLVHGADANCKNEDDETPLHLSARGGHLDCVKLLVGLVDNVGWKVADVEAKDKSFGRTALFSAAMEGHIECAKALLEAGASVNVVDAGSLNPHEHAVFRAHTDIAALLRPHIPPYPSHPLHSSLSTVAQASVVERAYGHKYLKGQSMIRVYLGSTDLRRTTSPVHLDEKRIPAQSAPGTFRLTVSAQNATGDPVEFDLPMTETIADPIVFHADRFDQVVLQFDVHPAYGDPTKKSRLVGRASAMLSTVKTSLWQERTPLGGSVEVPILSGHSMEIIGSVLFEFVVVKPFVHGNFKGEGSRTWKSNMTKVVGHRGLGMNKAAKVADGKGHLQLGENTLLSFITAGALGAEYVEFDVQLTKDLVPVLYHDFRVWETGYDLPLSTLTLSQFMSLRPNERPGIRRTPTSTTATSTNGNSGRATPNMLRRTMSMSNAAVEAAKAATGGSESWPTKGNDEGSVQLPFATLEDALKTVPTKIGFNVEVKYPNLQEAEQDELQNAEINVFCDRILDVIFSFAGDRNIYFSSFHPEVCWMLSMKQNHYPVFFLTEGGTMTTTDIRCNSLVEAVRFASRAGCLGIVTHVGPILEAPALIRAIRESGLLLFTYGGMNNEVGNVEVQRNYGVDAVIVDKVKRVFKALSGGGSEGQRG
ncbi:Glycerophosphoryl diester phosphodiesterase family-domain-containing protein [Fimicolochytrium jonesii]|uniref:Glycerophosphoryl diester phosphodiesterase family-domain-containing protein n=1 Tax=Fimicolochytrium jonesii TaxID=1396493 RepID=UPI0022FDB618|nr:Glycerophosphoryl diester phosphodiesterase family-domain-containing protein [Fimicolochytrium jonesii]KAI8823103.1 Glycerophosphoryl diester phosphodiesterase family-domain-containing protein [Fimicolochytrium jonesii]